MMVVTDICLSLLRWPQTFRGFGVQLLAKKTLFFRGCTYFNWDPCFFLGGEFPQSRRGHFGGISTKKIVHLDASDHLSDSLAPGWLCFCRILHPPVTVLWGHIVSHSYEANSIMECRWWVQKAVAHLDCLQLIPLEMVFFRSLNSICIVMIIVLHHNESRWRATPKKVVICKGPC